MTPFEPRRLSLVLCVLLACVPAAEPLSTKNGPTQENAKSQGLNIANASPTWKVITRMARARAYHTATLLPNGKVLVVGGDNTSGSAEVYDPSTGSWSSAASMKHARSMHTATLLPNGKVLVVGGISTPVTELYDPATNSWSSAASMKQARSVHTATLLPNGKVLVVGGNSGSTPLSFAEVYDPVTNTWSFTGSLLLARAFHTATLLPSGKVFVAGGENSGNILSSAELYDPNTGSWSFTGSTGPFHTRHTATLLPSGKVLVVGGPMFNAIAEVYDPTTGSWSSTGSPVQIRHEHTATLLANGKVLMLGGRYNGALASAEVYDPTTNSWSSTASLVQARHLQTATLLPDGQLIVTGGYGSSRLASAEVYDSTISSWSPIGSRVETRYNHTATLLPGGKVLVAGGNFNGPLGSAAMYEPATSSWSSAGSLTDARYNHTATLLFGGKVLVVGGRNRNSPLASTEVYDPNSMSWSSVGPLNRPRHEHTATLLPDGKVLVVGGYDDASFSDSVNPITSAELYDPVAGTWSPTGPLTQARARHTATLLPNGRVLVVGGGRDSNFSLASAELYDPATRAWSSTGSMTWSRFAHTATLLSNGKVLVVAGDSYGGSVEVYDQKTGNWSTAGVLPQIHYTNHTTTLLPNGKVLVVGGGDMVSKDPSTPSPIEEYDPSTNSWQTKGWIDRARFEHTSVLLPDGNVLIIGGENISPSQVWLYKNSAGESTWQPSISSINPSQIEPGTSITVTGQGFLGLSEASGGGTQSSPTNYPLLSLRSVENDLWIPLLANNFSNTSITATLPSLPVGHYLLNVTVHTVTSSQMIYIGNTTLPDTYLGAHTPTTQETQETQATFSFNSQAMDAYSFECSLDGTAFTFCTSPQSYLSLANGEHTFQVRAIDSAGNVDPSPAEYRWTVDTEPPETLIDTASAPRPSTLSTSARFSFSAEPGSSFECSLDGAAFISCSSPKDYSSLSPGEHTFKVRAQDFLGNVEPTPAQYTWTVDMEPPDTTISLAPPRATPNPNASFSFTSDSAGASFECSLDGQPFTFCTNPQSYPSLADREYFLRVRAIDSAGNIDPTPAEHQWIVDTTPPETLIDTALAPRPSTSITSANFSFSAEPGSSFECSLDGAAFIACISPLDTPSLGDGIHTFRVRARDLADNRDASPAEHHWTVDTRSPEPPSFLEPSSGKKFFTSELVFSGTAEPGSTVKVFVDGAEVGTRLASESGHWEITASVLTWSVHRVSATATDATGNTSGPSSQVSFSTSQRGYYGLSCTAGPATALAWPWALLILGLRRRRRFPEG